MQDGNTAGGMACVGRMREFGPAEVCERQLVELLLTDPGLVPTAKAAVVPDEVAHSGLRRVLATLYELYEAGAVPDTAAVAARLAGDNPALAAAAESLAGNTRERTAEERVRWLGRIVSRFRFLKAEATGRRVREVLAAGGAEANAILDQLNRLARLPG